MVVVLYLPPVIAAHYNICLLEAVEDGTFSFSPPAKARNQGLKEYARLGLRPLHPRFDDFFDVCQVAPYK